MSDIVIDDHILLEISFVRKIKVRTEKVHVVGFLYQGLHIRFME